MKYLKAIFIFTLISFVIGLAALFGLYRYIEPDLPSVDVLKEVRLQTPMRIYTHDGKLVSQYGVKRRIPVKLDEVPEQLIQAIIATEDSRFYQHVGIDPIGLTRAVINLLITGEKQQGASTLSMQLARGFFLSREKTYIRKIKEIFIALHMESELSKDEILELYLNKVELGHRSFGVGAAAQVYYGKPLKELTLAQIATIAGLPQAPSVLNPISRPERSKQRRRIVLLRMLDEGFIDREQFTQALNAPVTAKRHGAEIEVDAPYLADIIYTEMVGIYGKEEAETGGYQVFSTATSSMQLAAQQATIRNLHDYDERHGYRGPIGYLWNAPIEDENNEDEQTIIEVPPDDEIIEYLQAVQNITPLVSGIVTQVDELSIDVLVGSGERITISWEGLDWAREYITDSRQGNAPKQADDILREGAIVWIRQQEGQWRLSQLPSVSGAFVAIDPRNGAVQAVVGGYNYYQSQFNRVTQAKRQIGSNVKPFVYAAALDNGYTVASVINDAPINQWNARSGVAWRPQNSPNEYDGPIRMRKALGRSKNVVSIRLLRGVGLDRTVDYLTNFGFLRDEIPRDETLSLGSGSHTPLEVVRAMSVIANGGFLVNPHFISHIENELGEELWKANPVEACNPCNQVETVQDIEAQLAAELEGVSFEASADERIPAPQVISPQTAFLVADMMRTAVRANGNWNKKTYWLGTGWRARNILGRTDIGGKTGTTNDAKDTWFSGFTHNLVATSWVGFDDPSRQLGRATRNQNIVNRNPEKFNWVGNGLIGSEDGAKAAQPAWIRFMQQVLADKPNQPLIVPEDIVQVRVDRNSGFLTRRSDHTTLFEYFRRGTEPSQFVKEEDIIDPATLGDQKTEESDDIF
ncbi:penicillin-binding protein 1A [Alteromonas sp. 5E99-2]|uniref:penicillin-binding protein 1A n=1 Tax=Alteromonas sp. 5E99-2 TaxID=2817683 RepID=UPI001A99EFF5|nr:penicillin-binding protein 1A [Alteromonas sp. 5E99-2]